MDDVTTRWGVISTGAIARRFAAALEGMSGHTKLAVASRDGDTARAFAAQHKFTRAYGSYEELMTDPEVDAVYVATPHPMHLEWVLRAAAAGKAILCEKPMTLNAADTERAVAAAREHRVFLTEAFMYRSHPQTARLLEIVRSSTIGAIRVVRAHFSFRVPYNPDSRLFSKSLGGGGILDVGCYPVSFARLLAGAASGEPFADPVRLQATGTLAPNGVDAYSTALLDFANGVSAEVSCGVSLNRGQELMIYGDAGRLRLTRPFACKGGTIEIFRVGDTGGPEVETVDSPIDGYALEAEMLRHNLNLGRIEPDHPSMTHADSIGNARVLDQWLAALGVIH